jgi:hypothetical protein
VSTRRRALRAVLNALAATTAIGCCLLIAALALGRVGSTGTEVASIAAWLCGLAAAALAIAAAQERHLDDDPRYFTTIMHGLVDEWRR